MKNLNISVIDKVAKYLMRDGDIVCGNSDYQITFTFDEEWGVYDTKTARFIWNGKHTDQPFVGNICPVPIIRNTELVTVGVYAGDLCTTTPASIPCKRSILCESSTVQNEPTGVIPGDSSSPSNAVLYTEQTLMESQKEQARANIGAVGEAELSSEVTKQIDSAKANGEFNAGSGTNGATFTPSVSNDGILSWTNDNNLDNPEPVNIRGVDGKNGKDGKDGISATHSWDGTTLTVSSASGTSSADLKGEAGLTPYIKDDCWYIGEVNTGVIAAGNVVAIINVIESTESGGENKVSFSNGATITIRNGYDGTNGSDGVGISSIDFLSKNGYVDTYRITYTNGATKYYNVTNGKNGTDGKSAYQYAVDGGYTGTEAEFTSKMAQAFTTENWTFSLEDGSTVTKKVVLL